jgi:hypothetical protein
MIHTELVPEPTELPNLQLAVDSMELTPNENMLLLAAGPRLSQSADPIADLPAAVIAAAPEQATEGDEQQNPLSMLLATIRNAESEQLRALVILALQNTWATNGIELPAGGLQVRS